VAEKAARKTSATTGTRSADEGRMILVALDGSSRAAAVLAKAIAMAAVQGERLVLLRSIGLPADVPPDLWRSTDGTMIDFLDERARGYLDECEARVPVAARGGKEVVIGAPWQSICETARGLHCDLVVIGSHGYAGIDRLLGTTAAKVVNHAPCSVLVVRDSPAVGGSS
jgi:nucleotide-binding universal stress UspA family protein